MSEVHGGRDIDPESGEKYKSLVRYSKPIVEPKGGKDRKKKTDAQQETLVTNTQDILNSILPPLEYSKDKQHYKEYVLSTPATKADVIALQKELDNKLQVRRARETGICPVREELYAQCFDELIRQITIICAHRGLLLVRVRDEMRMTIQAYQTLYESALAFGMRFALKGEQERVSRHNLERQLDTENTSLEDDVIRLEEAIRMLEEEDTITKQNETEQHQREVNVRLEAIEKERKRLEIKLLENKG